MALCPEHLSQKVGALAEAAEGEASAPVGMDGGTARAWDSELVGW